MYANEVKQDPMGQAASQEHERAMYSQPPPPYTQQPPAQYAQEPSAPSTQQPPAPYTQGTPSAYTQQPPHLHQPIPSTSSTANIPPTAPDGGLSRPCVIPQTTKSFRGTFASPFTRAYTAELNTHGIDQASFLPFIDGLNEAFIGSPVFTGLNIAGNVMSQFHGIAPVQWAGMGLSVAAGFASAGTSLARTKAYLSATNRDLFHPAGLNVRVLATKEMMGLVGFPAERLQLAPLETFDQLSREEGWRNAKEAAQAAGENVSLDDALKRRMQALEQYVLPLDFNVPAAVPPDNLLKKMGASQAARSAKKQQEKMVKQRVEGHEEYAKKMKEADKKWREGTKEVEKVEKKIVKEEEKAARKMAKEPDKAMKELEKEKGKLLKELDKAKREREREAEKEMKHAGKEREKVERKEEKVANKIRWLVIANWDGEESQSEEEQEPKN